MILIIRLWSTYLVSRFWVVRRLQFNICVRLQWSIVYRNVYQVDFFYAFNPRQPSYLKRYYYANPAIIRYRKDSLTTK